MRQVNRTSPGFAASVAALTPESVSVSPWLSERVVLVEAPETLVSTAASFCASLMLALREENAAVES
jgi:hypothetical protein